MKKIIAGLMVLALTAVCLCACGNKDTKEAKRKQYAVGKTVEFGRYEQDGNVLICPDINSGNILYKSIEQFGGFTAAGPILKGFKKPASDLSRGSTVADVVGVIKVMQQLITNKE